MRKIRPILLSVAAILVLAGGYIAYMAQSTRAEITAFEEKVIATAPARETVPDETALSALPPPVRRYFDFVFPAGIGAPSRWVEFEQAGQFRRPLTTGFAPTTARQVIATAVPDLVFSADTPLWGPIWAIAYDAYVDGRMEMEARLLSTVSVMHEVSSPTLDWMSLRRWLLESPVNPHALLPGGIVRWEAMDETRARAVAEAHGYRASLVATFDARGALTSFHAEEDGDLTTPYHGSGEHVRRGDYRLIDGVRLPMSFEVSRMAGGVRYPFWRGKITEIRLVTPDRAGAGS